MIALLMSIKKEEVHAGCAILHKHLLQEILEAPGIVLWVYRRDSAAIVEYGLVAMLQPLGHVVLLHHGRAVCHARGGFKPHCQVDEKEACSALTLECVLFKEGAELSTRSNAQTCNAHTCRMSMMPK